MAVNNEYPVYDGIPPSWADLIVECAIYDGALFGIKDVAAINTSRSVEVGEKRGLSGGRVMGRTTGAQSAEASITFYLDGFTTFCENLATAAEAKGLVRGNEVLISLVHFDFLMQWSAPGSAKIHKRRVLGARVLGDTISPAEGTDAQQVEVPLSVIKIADVVNGRDVVLL